MSDIDALLTLSDGALGIPGTLRILDGRDDGPPALVFAVDEGASDRSVLLHGAQVDAVIDTLTKWRRVRHDEDAALLAAARCLPPGLLAALAKPDRRRVVYLAHSVGAATVEGVRANLAAAKRWLWALRCATDWSICAPWIPAVEAVLDSGAAEHAERERGLVDDLAVVERCDAIVLVGGRVSSGMALERDHASACGLLVIDLTDLGAVYPADDLTGNLAARLALAWSLR